MRSAIPRAWPLELKLGGSDCLVVCTSAATNHGPVKYNFQGSEERSKSVFVVEAARRVLTL